MKNNKLIAEFMGWTEDMDSITHEGDKWWSSPDTHKYHTSWDWLMPVVRNVLMTIELDGLDFDTEELRYNTLDCDINGVYKEVVQFIISNEYKTCDKCCYDIVDDNGDVMEHHCVDNQKDLALITSIIINEDVLGGTIFQTFDKAYALAEKFQDKFSHDFNWENQKLDFDEAIILFTKQELEKNYTI
jgi:hypothetical protein